MVYESDVHPPIPPGFTHILGGLDDGYTIRGKKSKNEYVWVNTANLKNNGTLDNVTYVSKYGRRDWKNSSLLTCSSESIPREYLYFIEKHNGFYISRYPISKNWLTGMPQSRKGRILSVSFTKSHILAKNVETENPDVKSHLIYGADWDTMISWLEYSNAFDSKNHEYNHILGLDNYIPKLTQEQHGSIYYITRGENPKSLETRHLVLQHRLPVEHCFYVALSF